MGSPMISAEVVCKAEFYDVDLMQVVWHGNYLKFLEQARSALMDKIGYNYAEMIDSGYAWPIVDARLKFVRPVRLGQRITVTATLVEYENRLKVTYLIRENETGALVTKASTVQLAVAATTGELVFQSPTILIGKVRELL